MVESCILVVSSEVLAVQGVQVDEAVEHVELVALDQVLRCGGKAEGEQKSLLVLTLHGVVRFTEQDVLQRVALDCDQPLCARLRLRQLGGGSAPHAFPAPDPAPDPLHNSRVLLLTGGHDSG